MTSDESNFKSDLDGDQAQLDRLEQEERAVETRNHVGFADVARRLHLEDRIRALDDEIVRSKEIPVRGEG